MKNKKPINLDGISLEENIPQSIEKIFILIAKKENDFIGSKIIHNGYIIKEMLTKCTISLQIENKLYTSKLKFIPSTEKWEIDGEIDHWENIDHLLF